MGYNKVILFLIKCLAIKRTTQAAAFFPRCTNPRDLRTAPSRAPEGLPQGILEHRR